MSNEENIMPIAAEETVGTDSSKPILKHLENCGKSTKKNFIK